MRELNATEADALRRLLRKVEVDSNGCWIWTGVTTRDGYGRIRRDGGRGSTHRLSYRLHYGGIPAGMFVCHRCDVKRCVNPEHLFLGTHQDNMNDMAAKGRARGHQATACPQGHPYSGPNLHIGARGERRCRLCAAASARRYRARQEATP